MVASLSGSGFIQLRKNGTVSLKEIYATGSGQTLTGNTGYYGYDRIYDDGGTNEYLQINPFQVEAGNAPDPALFPPSPISYSLAAWDGYTQWNSAEAAGTNFDCTTFDYDSATFSWTRAPGYTRNTTELRQYLFVDECGTELNCADYDASQDGVGADTDGAYVDDVTSYEKTGLDPSTWYAATVVTLWDISGSGTGEQVSDTYGISSNCNPNCTDPGAAKNTYDHIYFQTDACPVCTQISTIYYSTSAYAGVCDAATQTTIYTTSGDTTIAGLSIGNCLFTVKSGTPCSVCSSPPSGWRYIHDTTNYVEVSPTTGCVTTSPASCGGV